MIIDKLCYHTQCFSHQGSTVNGILNNGKQSFAQLHTHLMETFLAFVYFCLYCCIHGVEFTLYASSLLVSFCSAFLMLPDIIYLVCHSGKNSNCTGSIQAHVIEHLHHVLRISFLQTVSQGKNCFVRVLVKKICEGLDIHAGNLSELSGVGLHLSEHITERGCSHLILQQVLIHCSTEAHNLSLCQSQLLAESGHTCSKIYQVSSLSTAVLHQFVDGRTCSKHSAFQALPFILAKSHGKFSYFIYCSITQVIT